MIEIILENLIKILTALVLTLISVGGAYWAKHLGSNQKMQAINGAVQAVLQAAALTAAELQQTVVDSLKESAADGKLSSEEIAWLNKQLLEQTKAKLSVHVYDLINAAGADINALIIGAGEAWVQSLKGKE